MILRLKDRWKELWQKLRIDTVPQNAFEELIQAYSAADRFYHNLTHVADCLSVFDRTRFLAVHPAEVELAIWFHDIVYDTRREDNEQRSAEWAAKVIRQSGLGGDVVERVSMSILATRHHDEAREADGQFMRDVDLSIFGAETEAFWRYEENIRQEYAWVPEDLFRRKRKEILQRFLDRPYIYYHRLFREVFEEKARLHLRQASAKLSG